MSDQTFVYLIAQEGPETAFKIGIAADVQKRRAQLQTGNPIFLDVIWMLPCPSRRLAQEIERTIHSALEDYVMLGEWFNCDMVQAGLEVTRIAYSFRRPLGIREPADLLKFSTRRCAA